MTNRNIKVALMLHDMKQWELAKLLDVSESALTRKLRDELPEEEQARIIGIIEEASHVE